MSPTATNFFQDMVRGIGAGLKASDVNKPFQGMGAAISGAMSRTEMDEVGEKEYQQWLKKFETTKAAQEEAAQTERGFRQEERAEERTFQEKSIDRALKQLEESLRIRRESEKMERADLRSEQEAARGEYQSLLMDTFGGYAPRYIGSPSRGGSPIFALDGTVS